MLGVVTEQRKEVYTILVPTEIYLKSLVLLSRQHNSDTSAIPCCFSFGQVTVTVVTANYFKHTDLTVILQNL